MQVPRSTPPSEPGFVLLIRETKKQAHIFLPPTLVTALDSSVREAEGLSLTTLRLKHMCLWSVDGKGGSGRVLAAMPGRARAGQGDGHDTLYLSLALWPREPKLEEFRLTSAPCLPPEETAGS